MLVSNNPFPSALLVEQGSTPTAPSAGQQRLFIRTSDNKLCRVNSAGTVNPIETGTGGWTVITTTATGTQSDFAPSGLAGNTVLLCNNASLLTITGFANPVEGQRITIISIGGGNVALTHNATSAAANRLQNVVTSGVTMLSAGTGVAEYQYDATAALPRWRLVNHDQGAWITPTFSAGDYTTNGAGGITVASGDVTVNRYRVSGRQFTMFFTLNTISLTAAMGNAIRITLPNGYLSVAYGDLYLAGDCVYSDNGGANGRGAIYGSLSANSKVDIQKLDATNWTASVNLTRIMGHFVLELA